LGSLTQRKLDHFGISFEVKEEVKLINFEDYWNGALNRRPIDLVKIDIEGHELNGLNGFGEALFATKLIQFEFGGCNIDTKSYFQDFYYFFIKNDFNLLRITPLGSQAISQYSERDECFVTTNYIAINKRFL
jgi:hypothetical protein